MDAIDAAVAEAVAQALLAQALAARPPSLSAMPAEPPAPPPPPELTAPKASSGMLPSASGLIGASSDYYVSNCTTMHLPSGEHRHRTPRPPRRATHIRVQCTLFAILRIS